jgi:hypothetical protein
MVIRQYHTAGIKDSLWRTGVSSTEEPQGPSRKQMADVLMGSSELRACRASRALAWDVTKINVRRGWKCREASAEKSLEGFV